MKKEIKKIEELEAYIGKPLEWHFQESCHFKTVKSYDEILAIDYYYEQVVCAINTPPNKPKKTLTVCFIQDEKNSYFVDMEEKKPLKETISAINEKMKNHLEVVVGKQIDNGKFDEWIKSIINKKEKL